MGQERKEDMEKVRNTPINNQIEPDFLHHIESTFKRWNELTGQGVAIGTRELSNFAFTLKGAAMNSHIGFIYHFNPRAEEENGEIEIVLKIYTEKEQYLPGIDNPAYIFKTLLTE